LGNAMRDSDSDPYWSVQANAAEALYSLSYVNLFECYFKLNDRKILEAIFIVVLHKNNVITLQGNNIIIYDNKKIYQIPLPSEKQKNHVENIQKVSIELAKEYSLPIPEKGEQLNSESKEESEEHERAWHFDVNIKPAAGTVNDYCLIPATTKDVNKVVRLYQIAPVPGRDIKSVQIIYNPKLNRSFSLQMHMLQQRSKQPAFTPKWHTEGNSQQQAWRKKINDRFMQLTKPYTDPDCPAVKLLPLWHGTKRSILPSLFSTGYANLATTDAGFYGKGLYSAGEAEYSYRVYADNKEQEKALIVNWVTTYSAYPVIDGDKQKLMAGANYGNYDAHFIPVVPQNSANPNEVNYYPCKPNQVPRYTEMVVFAAQQCLPRYLVELQPSLPKELSYSVATNSHCLFNHGNHHQSSASSDETEKKAVTFKKS